jgi:hypothetical protein
MPDLEIVLRVDDRGINQTRNNLNRLGGDVRRAGSSTDSLTSSLKQAALAAGAVSIAIMGVTKAVEQFVTANIEFQRTIAGFNLIHNDMAKAREEMQKTYAVADRLGVSFRDVSSLWMQFSAALKTTDLAGEKAFVIFERTVGGLAKMGSSADEIKGALKALTQIASKGVGQAEEVIHQLGDRVIGVRAGLAKELYSELYAKDEAAAVGKFLKDMEERKLRYDALLPAFGRYMTSFDDGSRVDRLDASFNRLRNNLDLMAVALEGQVGILETIKMLFESLAESTKSIKESLEDAEKNKFLSIASRFVFALGQGIITVITGFVAWKASLLAIKGLIWLIMQPWLLIPLLITTAGYTLFQYRDATIEVVGESLRVGDIIDGVWSKIKDGISLAKSKIIEFYQASKKDADILSKLIDRNEWADALAYMLLSFGNMVQSLSDKALAAGKVIVKALIPGGEDLKQAVATMQKEFAAIDNRYEDTQTTFRNHFDRPPQQQQDIGFFQYLFEGVSVPEKWKPGSVLTAAGLTGENQVIDNFGLHVATLMTGFDEFSNSVANWVGSSVTDGGNAFVEFIKDSAKIGAENRRVEEERAAEKEKTLAELNEIVNGVLENSPTIAGIEKEERLKRINNAVDKEIEILKLAYGDRFDAAAEANMRKYIPYILAAAQKSGLDINDARMMYAIIAQETSFGKKLVNSESGATGPTQFMPDTAQDYADIITNKLNIPTQKSDIFTTSSDPDKLFKHFLAAFLKYINAKIKTSDFNVDEITTLAVSHHNGNTGARRIFQSAQNNNRSVQEQLVSSFGANSESANYNRLVGDGYRRILAAVAETGDGFKEVTSILNEGASPAIEYYTEQQKKSVETSNRLSAEVASFVDKFKPISYIQRSSEYQYNQGVDTINRGIDVYNANQPEALQITMQERAEMLKKYRKATEKELKELIKEHNEQSSEVYKVWNAAFEGVGKSFENMFKKFVQTGKADLDEFKSFILNWIADLQWAFLKDTFRFDLTSNVKVDGQGTDNSSGGGSSTSEAVEQASNGNLGSAALSIGSSVLSSSLSKLAEKSVGEGIANAFKSIGIGVTEGTAAASAVNSIAAVPNWGFAVASVASMLISSALFDTPNASIGSSIGGTVGSLAGAAMASALSVAPVVGTIVGAILGSLAGGGIGSLFDDKTEPRVQYIMTYTGDGSGFEDNTYVESEKFGLMFGLGGKSHGYDAEEFKDAFQIFADTADALALFYGEEVTGIVRERILTTPDGIKGSGGIGIDTEDPAHAFQKMFNTITDYAAETGDMMAMQLREIAGNVESEDVNESIELLNKAILATAELAQVAASIPLMNLQSLFKFNTDVLSQDNDVAEGAIGENMTILRQIAADHFSDFGDTAAEQILVMNKALENLTGVIYLTATDVNDFSDRDEFASRAAYFVDRFGDVDKWTEAQMFYFENFYSELERADSVFSKALGDLAIIFDSMGVEIPLTTEAFRDLMESTKAAGDEGANFYATLLDIAPTFAAVSQVIEDTTRSIFDSIATTQQQIDYQSAEGWQMFAGDFGEIFGFDASVIEDSQDATSSGLNAWLRDYYDTSDLNAAIETFTNDIAYWYGENNREGFNEFMTGIDQWNSQVMSQQDYYRQYLEANKPQGTNTEVDNAAQELEDALDRLRDLFRDAAEDWREAIDILDISDRKLPLDLDTLLTMIEQQGLDAEGVTEVVEGVQSLMSARESWREALDTSTAEDIVPGLLDQYNLALPTSTDHLWDMIDRGFVDEEAVLLLQEYASDIVSYMNAIPDALESLNGSLDERDTATQMRDLFDELGIETIPETQSALVEFINSTEILRPQLLGLAENTALLTGYYEELNAEVEANEQLIDSITDSLSFLDYIQRAVRLFSDLGFNFGNPFPETAEAFTALLDAFDNDQLELINENTSALDAWFNELSSFNDQLLAITESAQSEQWNTGAGVFDYLDALIYANDTMRTSLNVDNLNNWLNYLTNLTEFGHVPSGDQLSEFVDQLPDFINGMNWAVDRLSTGIESLNSLYEATDAVIESIDDADVDEVGLLADALSGIRMDDAALFGVNRIEEGAEAAQQLLDYYSQQIDLWHEARDAIDSMNDTIHENIRVLREEDHDLVSLRSNALTALAQASTGEDANNALDAAEEYRSALMDSHSTEIARLEELQSAYESLQSFIEDTRQDAQTLESSLSVLWRVLQENMTLAMSGDVDAMSDLPGNAGDYLTSFKTSAGTSIEYYREQGRLLNQLSRIGMDTEEQIDAQTQATIDALIELQDSVNRLNLTADNEMARMRLNVVEIQDAIVTSHGILNEQTVAIVGAIQLAADQISGSAANDPVYSSPQPVPNGTEATSQPATSLDGIFASAGLTNSGIDESLVMSAVMKQYNDGLLTTEEDIIAAIRRYADAYDVQLGFATGGIASGPKSGYTATLHGTEAIIPLGDGNVIRIGDGGIVRELAALREELSELRKEQQQQHAETAYYENNTAETLRKWDTIGLPDTQAA